MNKINSKGITLMSLVVYMTAVFVVLAAIIRVTTYFTKNIDETADVSFETEFEKFNLYMLTETSKKGNKAEVLFDNTISFSDGNTILYKDEDNDGVGEIYFNGIKLCKNVTVCIFSLTYDEQQTKVIINVSITIKDISKHAIYIMELAPNKGLPPEYQEVEYIGSTGTQYINTGVIPTNNLMTEIEYVDTSATGSNYVLGSRVSQSSTIIYAIGGSNSNNKINCAFLGGSYTFPDARVLNHRYHINLNVSHISETGYGLYGEVSDLTANTLYSGYTAYNANGINENPPPVFVFAFNSSNVHKGMKLYSLKFWESGTLIREFIPCYRKADEVAGLYDIVNSVFYTNSGSNSFTIGDEIVSKTQEVIDEDAYNIVYSSIPKTYQELEYIQNSGTQYINTGVVPTNNLVTELVFTDVAASGSNYVLGSRTSAGAVINYAISGSVHDSGLLCSWMGESYQPTMTRVANEKYKITLTPEHSEELGYRLHAVILDMTTMQKYSGDTIYTVDGMTQDMASIYVFSLNASNIHQGMKVHSLKLWDEDILIRDFVPCYRKADNAIGLYDKVNNRFYTNLGNNEFIKGPNKY